MEKNVCLAVIYKRRLLVIKSRRTWVLPRKKQRLGELEIDCIFRLIKEVLGLRVEDLMPLGKFNGKNFLQWSPIRDKVYTAKAEKEFFNNTFDQENGIKWIKNLENYRISKRTRRIFWILKNEGCL
jgi:uncharacterized membrane-anchored protein YjiN (DUF445 family)